MSRSGLSPSISLFLASVVVFSHHPIVFIALFLFFLGFTEAYKRYQSRLMLREGLMVAFFLAGLVVLGGQQKWWLQPVLSEMSPTALYYGATLLTAITDNAALTYLGSLVDGVSETSSIRWSLARLPVVGSPSSPMLPIPPASPSSRTASRTARSAHWASLSPPRRRRS